MQQHFKQRAKGGKELIKNAFNFVLRRRRRRWIREEDFSTSFAVLSTAEPIVSR
jgi:hypothetical protein